MEGGKRGLSVLGQTFESVLFPMDCTGGWGPRELPLQLRMGWQNTLHSESAELAPGEAPCPQWVGLLAQGCGRGLQGHPASPSPEQWMEEARGKAVRKGRRGLEGSALWICTLHLYKLVL